MADEMFGMSGGVAMRLKDTEERMNLLKERLLLLNQTFIGEQDRINAELSAIKESIRLVKEDTEKIRDGMEHIIRESAEFARKEEVGILERYIKMFEPLKENKRVKKEE